MKVRRITVHSEQDVIERSPSVTAVQRYTDLAPERWIGSYSLSPDMSKIVFASDRGQSSEGVFNYDIWVINADGSRPRQLTTNGSHDDLPVFLDDGKTIYFRSNRGSKWDLWKLELAGTDLPPEVEELLKIVSPR